MDGEASSGTILNLIFQQKGTALNFISSIDRMAWWSEDHLPALLANVAPSWTSK